MRAPQLIMFTAMAIFLMLTPSLASSTPLFMSTASATSRRGHYPGRQYWKQNSTLAARTILETKFGRCQFHNALSRCPTAAS